MLGFQTGKLINHGWYNLGSNGKKAENRQQIDDVGRKMHVVTTNKRK